MKPRFITAIMVAVALLVTATAANANPVSWHQAIDLTKRAASKRAARGGITLPASWWTVACYEQRLTGHWRCDAGAMRGYCNAGVWIRGTRARPIVTKVQVYCFD
jgi:hypothetical protein